MLGRPEHWTLSVLITDQAVFQSNIPFAAAMAIFLMLVCLMLVGVTLGSASGGGPRHDQSGRNLFMALVVLFLAAPLIVVAGVSLNAERQLLFPPRGLSLAGMVELFRSPTG